VSDHIIGLIEDVAESVIGRAVDVIEWWSSGCAWENRPWRHWPRRVELPPATARWRKETGRCDH